MLKIRHYEAQSFLFYLEIANAKRNTEKKPRIKQELEAITDKQSACFDVYDEAFSSRRLAFIAPEQYSASDKANLKSLYSYRIKKVQELKQLLTTHPLYRDRILNTCQNCTINEVDSMDHILGQSGYPEFSVHPKNLFPCCSVCNKKKSDRYTDEDGSQLFLNLYLDDLPQSQYLKVEFGDGWLPRFWLEKPHDVPDIVFALIQSHYKHLDLLNRFRDSSNEIISSLRYTIKAFGTDRIQERIEELCKDLEPILGYNHRQIVLTRALGMSEKFIRECVGIAQAED